MPLFVLFSVTLLSLVLFFVSLAAWSMRTRIRFALITLILFSLLCGAYTSTEGYHANKGMLEGAIRTVPFLKNATLPDITLWKWIPAQFRFGLDIRGGTHLVYDADVSKYPAEERASGIEGLRDVIERRVNAFGVAEPMIQSVKSGEGYRMIVELAGVTDVNQAIKMIGDTALLEFKEQAGQQAAQKELTEEQKKEMKEYNDAANRRATEILKKTQAPNADFAAIAKEFSESPEEKDKAGDLGYISKAGAYSFLESPVSKIPKGTISKDLLNGPDGISIVRVDDIRTTEKEVKARHILICYKGASSCERETSKDDARKQIEELAKQATAQNFEELAKKNSTEPGAAERGGDLDWFAKGMMVKQFEDAVFSMKKGEISGVIETDFGFHLIYREDERPLTEYKVARILIKVKTEQDYLAKDGWQDTGLTGEQLKRAYVEINPTTNAYEVGIEFDDEGKKLFGEITERNINKPVGIFLDRDLISAPNVNSAIKDGRAVIQGDFTALEAKQLAQRLNAGALPVPVNLISQQTVGASLGEVSLHKSLFAGLLGLFFVALFMILYYRLAGLLAVIALVMYIAFSVALFKFGIPFIGPVTMTLAGIAGFILSIGMAVDANVLIFERMKEELKAGKQLEIAIRDGYKRAWTSIRDSNASSLITCFILFTFSASLIKGFALVLAAGILVSMFTALTVTKLLLRVVSGWRIANNTWLFGAPNKKDTAV